MCDVDAYEAESQTMPELRASYVVVRTNRGCRRGNGGGQHRASVPGYQVPKDLIEKNTDY